MIKKILNQKFFLPICALAIFLFFGLYTNSNYGISWDEPTHFKRGQAYLHYFITGKLTYDDLPDYDPLKARTDPSYHERSVYQIDSFNVNYHLNNDGGHPPLNGILASLGNYIFYQKLGVLQDIEGYHVFGIFVSAALVGLVCLWASETFGKLAGAISAIFMATYPLFLGESHFNIKDPIETAFFVACLYFLWKAFDRRRARFFIVSGIFAGLALGTKFNIFFAAPIVFLWFLIAFSQNSKKLKKFIFSPATLISIVAFPILVAAIFFGTWPYLWQDFINNTVSVFQYYKDIGTETNFQPSFFIGDLNTYAIRWIILTTQPILLFSFILGLIRIRGEWKKNSCVLVLWFLLFAITVVRVTMPQTSIYGGVRQIMEYIPAMALIGGVGAAKLIELLGRKSQILRFALVAAVAVISIGTVVSVHPNENVYFNGIAGGLAEAKRKGIPGAGNSFGNGYRQAVMWLNENAPIGAKIALVQGTNQNIPQMWFRPDLSFSNYHWSGILREGEYVMELTHNYETKVYWYAWEYVENMLNPAHMIKVQNADIATIWKNDLAGTKIEFTKQEQTINLKSEINKDHLRISLNSPAKISRIRITYDTLIGCTPTKSVRIETSLDNKKWITEKDADTGVQLPKAVDKVTEEFQYFFAARDAKYIKIYPANRDSCLFKSSKVSILAFPS